MTQDEDTHPTKKKAGRPVADSESRMNGLRVLEHIKTRKKTGSHTEGLTKAQRNNVTRQLDHFEYNSENVKLYKKESSGDLHEVL